MNKSYPLYFHIGYPKTATSFLQDEIFPQFKSIHFIPLSELKDPLLKITSQDEFNFDYKKIREDIISKLDPDKPNLISFEGLCGEIIFKHTNQKQIADRLHKLFPESHIIIIIRNQYDLIKSLYRQSIHLGGTKKFTEFINFQYGKIKPSYITIDGRVNLEMFKFLPLIDYYNELFNPSNVHIILFEIIKVDGIKKFVEKFISILRTNDQIKTPNKLTNEGYQLRQIQIARFLNKIFKKNKLIENGLIPDIPIPKIGRLNTSLIRKILQSKLSFKLLGHKPIDNPQIKLIIKEYFKENNLSLDKKYNLSLSKLYQEFYF